MGVAAEDHNEHTVVERHDPLLGAQFDRRFSLDARLAAGGFGTIYRATHLKSGHEFALKILHANMTSDPRVVARFRREGAALTRLRDPHTVTAYELGEAADGTLYIVLELLQGETLHDRVRTRGPLPWNAALRIARAVCNSLGEAHAYGIIHRDLKPTNIHLENRGGQRDFVKVLDFGIAKILHDNSDLDDAELTAVGQMIGTLDYMSPEQIIGGQCTPATDLYTLGVVMYEMLAGRKPYDVANSAAAALAAIVTTTPPRISELALVTPEVDQIVMRCLERQPADRFQSAVELADAIDRVISQTDDVPTSVAPAGAAAAEPPQPSTVPVPVFSLRPPGTTRPPQATPSGTPAPEMSMRGQLAATLPEMAAQADAAAKLAATTQPLGVLHTQPATLPMSPEAMPFAIAEEPIAPAATPAAIPTIVLAVPPPVAAAPIAAPASAEPSQPIIQVAVPPIAEPPQPIAPPTPSSGSTTLVGAPIPRLAPPRHRVTATPVSGTQTRSLRESYPTINRPPPSAMRPPETPFDDRPPSNVTLAPYVSPIAAPPPVDLAHAARIRHDALIRRIALGVIVAAVIAAALILATQL